MKKLYKRAAWILAVVLCFGSAAGCSGEEIRQFVRQSIGQEQALNDLELEEAQNSASQAARKQEESSWADKSQEAEKEQIPQSKKDEAKGTESKAQPTATGRFAYSQLEKAEQAVYDEMLSVILEQEEKIELSTMDTEQMRHAYTALCSDYGGLFWVEGYVFTRYTRGGELVSLEFSPKYTMTKEERQETQQQIDSIVQAWFAGISINDTDYDKVKYVYELLALNTEYVENAPDSQNIISVFIRQQTVCQGYACAVQYLLEQLGVQSMIVSGKAMGQPHAWNLVRMDGEYYYLDATWGNNGYRNKEGQETSFIDYNYMAMTTEEMNLGHKPDGEIKLPECTAVLNNYYRKEGNYVEEWNPDQIGARIAQAWEQKQVVTLRFSDESLKQQAFEYFIQDGRLTDYCSGITRINYIEDDLWKEISFCFNQET